MTPYWILLLIPLFFCLQGSRLPWAMWQSWLIVCILTLFIGLRHQVGGDWFNYLPYLYRSEGISFREAISSWGDPGYNALNWLFASYSWGIYGVNTLGAIVFSIGLVLFCRTQPRPWLALSLTIPYLVIVVAMGYSRQGVALGLIMPGLLSLERGRLRPFLASMTAAATFHSMALAMLVFVVPAVPGRTLLQRLLRLILLLIVGLVLAQTFLFSQVDGYVSGYIVSDYQSEGAAIRVAMNLLPAFIFLYRPYSFGMTHQQSRLWRAMSYAAVICAVVLLLFPSKSTAVDRISLYIIPLQIAVGSRLPSTNIFGLSPRYLLAIVLVYIVSVQFVWFNFASHTYGWLPYQNFLLL